MRGVVILALLLVGCSVHVPVTAVHVRAVSAHSAEPPAPPSLPPVSAVENANRAIAAAAAFVARPIATPDEIDQLTGLVRNADEAVRAHPVRAPAVRAATAAIDAWLKDHAP